MNAERTLRFRCEEEDEYDLVLVEIAKDGLIRTLKEVPRESVLYAQQIAAISGDDWHDLIAAL
jgi:hypothetical protein